MNTVKIDFFDEFKCIGGKCPHTCCANWKILIDDNTKSNYLKADSTLSILGHLCSKTDRYGNSEMRKLNGRCLFLTHDGLCQFECKQRKDLMPDVCKIYPRQILKLSNYTECTLELSCFKAAQIFVSNLKRHSFISSERFETTSYKINNNDPDFLEFLLKDRDLILDYLWTDTDIDNKFMSIYVSTYEKHKLLMRDRLVDAYSINSFNIEGFSSSFNNDGFAFFPISFLNGIIYDRLSYPDIKKRNPVVYELVSNYKSIFGSLYEKDADAFFNKKLEELCNKNEDFKPLFTSYFSYLIQQTYINSYEYYYLIGPILLSILHTEFLMLFILVANISNIYQDKDGYAHIICSLEKALRHSPSFNKYLINLIRKDFLQ